MLQVGRNLIDADSGALALKRYLIVDRDAKYTERFRNLVKESGAEVIRLPSMSSNLNAYAERFVRSIKDECWEGRSFLGRRRCDERSPNSSCTIMRSAIIRDWRIS
jgi:putative transposase